MGEEVEGLYKNGHWYPAKVNSIRDDGGYLLDWNDGDAQDRVKAAEQLRRPAAPLIPTAIALVPPAPAPSSAASPASPAVKLCGLVGNFLGVVAAVAVLLGWLPLLITGVYYYTHQDADAAEAGGNATDVLANATAVGGGGGHGNGVNMIIGGEHLGLLDLLLHL